MGEKGTLLDWETIEKGKKGGFPTEQTVFYVTRRLKVPGGWLVYHSERTTEDSSLSGFNGSMTFLPDPDYEWSPAQSD